jgi:transcriptional regulator with GAF, ATPase, and Fis domain
VVEPEHLQMSAAAAPRTLAEIVDAATEAAVRGSMRRHGRDAGEAARELGIDDAELRRLVQRFGIR